MLASASPEARRVTRAQRRRARPHDELPEGSAGPRVDHRPRAAARLSRRATRACFVSALEESIGIERPPPAYFYTTQATTLGALQVVPTRSFFSPSARKRVIVLTDGETRETGPRFARVSASTARGDVVRSLLEEDERIYESGIAEAAYKPDPKVAAGLDRAAEKIGGRVYDEGDAGGLVAATKDVSRRRADTPDRARGRELALMPFATALAGLPLLLVLRRRNL